MIERILVATDRSDTATRAVAWAAEMSGKFSADLLVLPVVPPEHLTGQDGEGAIQAATDDLAALSAPTRKLAEVTTGSPCSR